MKIESGFSLAIASQPFEFLGFFLCNATLVLLSETKNFLLIFIWRALCCYMRHKSELSPLELSHYNFFTYSMSHIRLLPFPIFLQTYPFQIQGSYCWTYSSSEFWAYFSFFTKMKIILSMNQIIIPISCSF